MLPAHSPRRSPHNPSGFCVPLNKKKATPVAGSHPITQLQPHVVGRFRCAWLISRLGELSDERERADNRVEIRRAEARDGVQFLIIQISDIEISHYVVIRMVRRLIGPVGYPLRERSDIVPPTRRRLVTRTSMIPVIFRQRREYHLSSACSSSM